MEYSSTDLIEFPIEDVFSTHRDHLPDLAEFLPNVESIVVESRTEEGGEIHLVNLWTGSKTEVPKLIRPFVKPEMLKWIDRASWDESTRTCRYSIELGFLKEAIHVSGLNRMRSTDEGHTEVTIAGEIRVDARKIPGVPKFMAKKVGGVVENFVVKTITPNLKKTNDGVRRFLSSRQSE